MLNGGSEAFFSSTGHCNVPFPCRTDPRALPGGKEDSRSTVFPKRPTTDPPPRKKFPDFRVPPRPHLDLPQGGHRVRLPLQPREGSIIRIRFPGFIISSSDIRQKYVVVGVPGACACAWRSRWCRDWSGGSGANEGILQAAEITFPLLFFGIPLFGFSLVGFSWL